MTKEEVSAIMAGYSLHSYSAGYAKMNFIKQIDDTFIHAEVYPEEKQVSLYTIVSTLTISTGKFSLTHPHFGDWFEDRIIKAIRVLRIGGF